MSIPNISVQDLISTLRNSIGVSMPEGLSDQLGASYLSTQGQQSVAAMNAASQIAQQQAANQLRQAELMGADQTGAMTDAAARWRQELTAQQDVQNERLRQEQMQMLGYNAQNPAQTTLQQRQLTSQEAEQQRQQALRLTELMGYERNAQGQVGGPTLAAQGQQAEIARQIGALTGNFNGQATMDAQRLANEAQQAQAERALRVQLQSGQLGQQEAEFARNYLLQQEQGRRQQEESTRQQATLAGYMDNGQLTEAARQARAAEALAQANASGILDNGQLTEEARATRAREALQGAATYGVGDNGQMTEAARAAREGERSQRAKDAAALTQSSRDIFRANNYFREMGAGGADQFGLGVGGGALGFSSGANRAMGTPGTISMADVEAASGQQPNSMIASQQPNPMIASQGGPINPYGNMEPSYLGADNRYRSMLGTAPQAGAAPPPDVPGADRAAREASANAMGAPDQSLPAAGGSTTDSKEQVPGMEPGGPTEPVVGMGAGGAFVGRRDPRVREFVRQLAAHDKGAKGVVGKRRNIVDDQGKLSQSAAGVLEADKRYDRGLKSLYQKMLSGGGGGGAPIPGTQPGGPVGAPLWPTNGGTGQMTVESPQTLGMSGGSPPPDGGYSMAAAPSYTAPFAQADVGANDQRLANFRQALGQYGIQGMGPQFMEKAGKTGRGAYEGAFEALGLTPDDANEAYALTRFANSGNAQMA